MHKKYTREKVRFQDRETKISINLEKDFLREESIQRLIGRSYNYTTT